MAGTEATICPCWHNLMSQTVHIRTLTRLNVSIVSVFTNFRSRGYCGSLTERPYSGSLVIHNVEDGK
jgi:hypothetical protein